MAANYWTSSQHAFTTKYVPNSPTWHQLDVEKLKLTIDDCKRIEHHYVEWIWSVANEIGLRARVSATATIYFKKLYASYNFVEVEPSLAAGTCLNLAAKMEESPIRIDVLLNSSKFKFIANYHVSDLQNCEFYVLNALECHLVVYHPFRALFRYSHEANLESSFTEYALKLLNDSYYTDVLLRYPPYMIAFACLILTYSSHPLPQDSPLNSWFNKLELSVLSKMVEIGNEILNMYAFVSSSDWSQKLSEALLKIPKPQMKHGK